MLNQSTFVFLLFVLLWFIVPIDVHAQDTPASKAELEASLRPIRNDIKDGKQDGKVLRQELSQKIDGVRSEISGLRSDMQNEISGLRSDMQNEISGLRSDMREDFKNVEGRIGAIGGRIDSIHGWIVGGVIAIIVALLGLVGTLWHTRSKPEDLAKIEERIDKSLEIAGTNIASEETLNSLSNIASRLQELVAAQQSSLDLNDRLNALREDSNERE